MTFPLILTLVLAPCAGFAILLLVRRLTAPAAISECDPEWVANFSIASYRPMLRLLTEDDCKYFASQRGVSSKAVQELRRERRRIFKSYLRNLVKDFHRLHLAARMTLIYATEDRPEFAQTLLRQRVTFAWAVMMVELRLALHAFGLGPVDVRQLLGALEDMRTNIASMPAAPQAAGY
jgi:hypothetical protein